MKWTIGTLDKQALINIINGFFTDGVPDIIIIASRLTTIDRQLTSIHASLGKTIEKLKKTRGKKRGILELNSARQYRIFNKLVKEREQIMQVLKGTCFDPLREQQDSINETIKEETA